MRFIFFFKKRASQRVDVETGFAYTCAMRETLGQKLQRLRLDKGLTQVQLAALAEVPLPSLRSWETDHREPSLRAAVRLAVALDSRVEELADTSSVRDVGKTPRPAGPTLPRKRASKGTKKEK